MAEPKRPSRRAYHTVGLAPPPSGAPVIANGGHGDDDGVVALGASSKHLVVSAATGDDDVDDVAEDAAADDNLHAGSCPRRWGRELRTIVSFGWANSVNQVLQFTAGFVMMMFFSTADEIGGGGMGFMFTNVTGISLLVGFGTGLTPLASQAFGAGNPRRVGDLFQRQLLMHVLVVCVPVAVVWLYAEEILLVCGQPAITAALTGDFARWRIASLPFYALQLDLEGVLQCAQAPVLPRTVLYGLSAALNVVLFWLLIGGEADDAGSVRMGLGFIGAPLAFTVTNIATSMALLWLAPRLLSDGVWPKWNIKAAMSGWGELARLSAPAALMLWAEWWGGELTLFMAGLLCTLGVGDAGGNQTTAAAGVGAGAAAIAGATTAAVADHASCLPVDVFPLLSQMLIVAFMAHLGFSIQGGAHVGNLLGANKPRRAATASQVTVSFVGGIGLLIAVLLLTFRSSWGRLFTTEDDIVEMMAALMPFLAAYVIGDSLGASGLANILRGAGIVRGPAVINIVAFYCFGIPIGIWLAFGSPGWGVFGLYTGMATCVWTMTLGLAVYLFLRVDFPAAAREAAERAAAGVALPAH